MHGATNPRRATHMIFRHLGAKDFGVQNFFRPRQELLLQIPANMVNVYNGTWASVERSRAQPCCSQAHKSKTFPPIHVAKLCNQLPPFLTEKPTFWRSTIARNHPLLSQPNMHLSRWGLDFQSLVGLPKGNSPSLPLKLHSGKCLSDSHPRLSLVKCLTIGTSPSDLQCCLNFVYAAANFFGMLLPSSFAAHSRSDQGFWFTVNFKTGDQLKKVFGESLVDD